jgi:peptidoglycan biosynthesis protein MviN/MurJ (putative lipid II flippase)
LEVVAWTIPVYAVSLFLVKVHHSRKDMKAPLRAALVSLGTNFLLSVLLMGDYGVFGLAWANLISAFCQTTILMLNLSFFKFTDFLSTKKIALVATASGCLIMALFLYYCQPALPVTETKIGLLVKVLFLVFSSILIYGLALAVLKFPEVKLLLQRKKLHGL